ncbi:MAG: polysaccharide deacetylase family protein [Flavobacteriaceae bacterium]|nr:polysaccharide deacetylase family protein [Flavobacteriaceae bacterium]
MLLVYTHKITPRVNYIFKHIFVRILQIPVSFTTKVEEFVAHNGPKISYSKVPLGSEFFIRSHGLLFEQGVNDVEIIIQKWDDEPCFFATGDKSTIPFDIFAASFYLLSRYEEYLPFVKDTHERFSPHQSVAYQNGFLEKPIIDIWAYQFLASLQKKFPDYTYTQREFKFISTINVSNVFAFKHKGVMRTLGGFTLDFFSLKWMNFWSRFLVVFNFKRDPYNTFDHLLKIQKETGIDTLFFFLISNYTTFDTSISTTSATFVSLIKSVGDYAKVGLLPSYFTFNNRDKLKKEKSKLESITNVPLYRSRQHYLRLNFPDTYENLLDLDILEDYSMGYNSAIGFRASTCTPFYFYNIDLEIQTPLKLFPFAVSDRALNTVLKYTVDESLVKIASLKSEVKKVNGTFITVFHNESVGNYGEWEGWKTVYKNIVK